MVTSPRLAGVSPAMIRIVVVLPAPLGPRNPVTRPGWQVKLMSSRARNAPYDLESPSTLIMGAILLRARPLAASDFGDVQGPTGVGP